MTEKIIQSILKNGMHVLLKEIHTAPIISSWIWYRVGSRDEVTGRTGVSHWTEHMQFKGTKKYPATILDKAIAREGGTWNAFTFLDWTTYFETMPADKIDLALSLEADRMTKSLFDEKEVESERTVIIAEREGHENDPLFRLGEAVQQAAFRVHPYHHEVIGDMPDLLTISRDDLFGHYRTYYNPNNVVMTAAGDFDARDMLKRIKKLFEKIPAGRTPPRLQRVEPQPLGEVRLVVEGPGETTYLQVAYRFPNAAHKDFHALTVLDSLLSGPSNLNMFGGGISNKTSRIYRALVDNEYAVSASGGAAVTIDPFLYTFNLTVHPKRNVEETLAALDTEINKVQEESVSGEEIRRAVKQARAIFAYGSENITNQAFWLGFAEMFADYEWFTGYLKKLERITPQDVKRVAGEYFRPRNRIIGTYVAKGTEG